jgi:ubiquinone/menaquinone biosynthesis C-methylase UbiE
MGLIFDGKAARLYEAWYHSPQGRAMETLVTVSIPVLLEPQPGERILDVGCGEGNHLSLFNPSLYSLSGLDASPFMIRRAKDRLGSRAHLKTGRAEDLPFEDNEFDLALFINTLEFLDDPLAALKEAGRVAKRSVFIGVTNSLSWYFLCTKMQRLLRKPFFDHFAFFNLWQLKSYIRAAYGSVPVQWRCSHINAPILERIGTLVSEQWHLERCPFGSFLGLCVPLRYTMRTAQQPLTVGLGKAKPSAVEGMTLGNAHRNRRGSGNERSLFV